jgi:acyl dehydratase
MTMELDSKFVGRQSAAFETEVTWRQMMNYAAGVGDGNPRYYDDESDDGPLAHPMLAVALTWPLCEHFADFWQIEDFPYHIFQQQVHYNEVITYHRPVRAGDKLKLVGDVVAILPHPAGTNMGVLLTATDADDEVVFTEYTGGILRGVKCVGGKNGAENVPEAQSLRTGEPPIWDTKRHIDPWAAHVYDGCTDIVFPIHTSMKVAKGVGLPRPIYHGTATLSMAVSEVVNREAGGDAALVKRIGAVFTAMVLPDSDITIQALGTTEDENGRNVFFDVLNDEGKKAISRGQVTLEHA